MILDDIDALMCDLDGVVYRADRPIPGAIAALQRVRERGIAVLFCTNNSNPTLTQYVDKLTRMGLAVAADDILTSAVVTAEVLADRGCGGSRAFCIGGDGIREELTRIGVVIDDDPAARSADLVVVGLDPAFDYDAMRRSARAVRAGAMFVATNDDAAFPAVGQLWPGAGAILASIETATGRAAEVMGKPNAPMMDAVVRRCEPGARIAVVGDRPGSDLAGGWARGWPTILVLSGVTSRDEVDGLERAPDVVLESLAELEVQ